MYFDHKKTIILLLLLTEVMLCTAGAVSISPYAKKVRRISSGAVYLKIKSEKQHGETCNPTSMSMILDYYGIYVSSAKLRKDSEDNDDPDAREAYKTHRYLQQQLKKYNMEMLLLPHIKGQEKAFFEAIKRAVDCGIPMQWSVRLLKAPDYDISQRHKRAIIKDGGADGHARVLNGYKISKRTREIEYFIFTDSWGMRHRKKEIKPKDLLPMTQGVFLVVPAKLNRRVLNYIYAPYGKSLPANNKKQ